MPCALVEANLGLQGSAVGGDLSVSSSFLGMKPCKQVELAHCKLLVWEWTSMAPNNVHAGD